jgi:hypothetical protein
MWFRKRKKDRIQSVEKIISDMFQMSDPDKPSPPDEDAEDFIEDLRENTSR